MKKRRGPTKTAQQRREAKARLSRMARTQGGIVVPGHEPELPKTQVLLIQLLQQGQAELQMLSVIGALLEANLRAANGQTLDDIEFATGISIPPPTAEERAARLEAEAKAEQDRLAMEEEAREAVDLAAKTLVESLSELQAEADPVEELLAEAARAPDGDGSVGTEPVKMFESDDAEGYGPERARG